MLVLSFFKLIGRDVGFNTMSDFRDEYWQVHKETAINDLKTLIDSLFASDFEFDSCEELDKITSDFLDSPDLTAHNVRSLEIKDVTLF